MVCMSCQSPSVSSWRVKISYLTSTTSRKLPSLASKYGIHLASWRERTKFLFLYRTSSSGSAPSFLLPHQGHFQGRIGTV